MPELGSHETIYCGLCGGCGRWQDKSCPACGGVLENSLIMDKWVYCGLCEGRGIIEKFVWDKIYPNFKKGT